MLALYTVVLAVACASAGAAAQVTEVAEEKPRVLCGRTLADARVLYCFSTNPIQKKSLDLPIWPPSAYNYEDSTWPWFAGRSQERALTLSSSRSKRMSGLVDECCFKACYVSELLNYC